MINLRWFLVTLVRGWWLVILVMVLTVVIAAAALKAGRPMYQASMTIAPATQDLGAPSSLVADLEQFADFAALGQTPIVTERASPFERYLEVLTSIRMAERLASDTSIMRWLFAAEWDPETERFRPPESLLWQLRAEVGLVFGFPEWSEPGPERLASALVSRVQIRRAGSAAMRSVVFEHPRRDFTTRLLGALHENAEAILRTERARNLERVIAELETAIDDTRGPRRAALSRALQTRYELQAMLRAGVPYGADLINPPSATALPVSPPPLALLSFALVVGIILGVIAVFLRDAVRIALRTP